MKYLRTRAEYIYNEAFDYDELIGFWLVCELHGDLEYFEVESAFLEPLMEEIEKHCKVMHF